MNGRRPSSGGFHKGLRDSGGASSVSCGLDYREGDDLTPEEVAIFAEEVQRLLGQLGDPEKQKIAVAVMEGYSNKEIAQQLNCAVRTVERRRELIRKKWMRELTP